jgi:two-component system, OmpR family, response regulator
MKGEFMLTILVIEDDENLRRLFSTVLIKNSYKVLQACDGIEAWNILENQYVDLIISDIMMPNMDGFEFIKSFRNTNCDVPILIITAKNDFLSKEKGYRIGTDDYMVKPIDVNEMILRIGALLRRAKIAYERRLTIGQTTFDYDSLTVSTRNERFELTQKEFYLLYKLASYPDKIYTRQQLMDEIWGFDSESDSQTIDVHINRLRRRFENIQDFQIVTVRGLGYKVVRK